MNKLLSLIALSALIVAPSCMFWNKSCSPCDTKTEKVEKKKSKKPDCCEITVKE